MKVLLILLIGACSSVAAAAAAENGASGTQDQICAPVEVLTRTGRTARRVCLTAAQWRSRLGPDWRNEISGRTVEGDMELVYLRSKQTDINGRTRTR